MLFNMISGNRSIHFCLVGLLCMIMMIANAYLVVGESNISWCVEKERQALLKFKRGLVDDSNTLASWESEKDCCKWSGITCNNRTGHVVKLELRYNNSASYPPKEPLRGEISPPLLELKFLSYLDLSNNDFTGHKIPKFIGSLSKLRQLKLAEAHFHGSLPRELGNLSFLHTLDVSHNFALTVDNLEWLSPLSSLKYLNLSGLYLSKVVNWPQSITKLPSLIELTLQDCQLSDIDPRSLSKMNSSKTLQVLKLSGNDFTSSIFSWLFNISSSLIYLQLRANKLKGPLPDAFTNAVSNSLVFLDLSFNKLEGEVPNSFQNICSLKHLYLSYNKLSGQLQHSVERLSCAADTLIDLDLGYNQFRGPFPDLTRFSSLETISLQNNSLNGSLPQSFGQLSKVKLLSLAFNQLSGLLPDLGGLTSLEELDLLKNQLNGSIPESLGHLSRLRMLDLSSNSFSGVITKVHFLNLSSLESMRLSNNALTFNVSSDLIPPFQLKELAAASCKLGPPFPKWLRTQRKLESLDISKAHISDLIPDWFWDLSSSLAYMNLSLNQIHGKLPNLSSKTYVYPTIDLSSNHLYGPLPPFPPNSTVLIFSKNMFSGNMYSLCETRLAPLYQLDLSDNMLSGELPTCWLQLKELFALNLANNNFSGKIPLSLASLPQIALLHLRNNSFSGELPSFQNHKELVLLDIGENRISGRIPEWSGQSLPSLTVLRLRSNELYGSIPTSFCSLPALQILDFSLNNISGVLPKCLDNMTAMLSEGRSGGYIDFTSLMWKGIELEFGRNAELVRSIDFSSNYLSGEIPEAITSLLGLHNLNLSRNGLRGRIPVNFGQLNMLQSLDLSRNQLVGTIPASFSSLNFLSHLDLSYNNLTGRIPLSTQLQSFEASAYEGNVELCGPPLTKYCPGDPGDIDGNGNGKKEIGDEDEYVTFGFYVSLAVGFIVGFWGVCGTLVIKSSWRYVVFRSWDDIKDWIYVTTRVLKARLLRELAN